MSTFFELLPTTWEGWAALITIAAGLGGALGYALKWAQNVPDLKIVACDFEHRSADQ